MQSRINRTRPGLFSSIAIFLVAACSGGNGTDNGNPGGDMNPPPASFDPVFSAIQANVFTPNCAVSGCHTGAGAPQGLRLDEANSFGLLVDQPSSQVPSLRRVAPNDPDNSYLIRKLEGTASVGQRMPLNAAALPQAEINIIRQWITDGALDDRAPSPDPIRVTSLSPVPDADLDTPPAEIMAMFDRELDVSTVNANTFLLERSGGDGTFGDGNEVSIAAASITTSPGTTPTNATFDLTGVALADDTYRVRLLGDGASMILDIDANALDGEFTGTFPSGDGVQGGDFEAMFTLTTAVAGPTLDAIQAAVFTPECAGCHSGPTSNSLPSGMNLSNADASFNALVGVPSVQEPGISRVAAGDPDNSYLVHKIEGTAATGARMPAGGAPPLDQAEIDDIREWITNGAER